MPFMIVLLIAGNIFRSREVTVTVILGASLIYGFLPSVTHHMRLIGKKRSMLKIQKQPSGTILRG
jgi:hypothetical protein